MEVKRRRTKRRRLNVFRFIIVLAVILVAGSAGGYVFSKMIPVIPVIADNQQLTTAPITPKPGSTASPIKSGLPSVSSIATVKPTVKPTPKPTATPKPAKKNITNLRNDLAAYIKKFKGQYGIYYYNLYDGTEFGINATDTYVGASTTKVPLNLYLFKKIQDGTVNPKATLVYTKADYEEGTGVIAYNGKFGNRYTIQYLSMQSIENSDNVATNMLYRYLGKYNVKNFMKKMGGQVVSYNQNITCPKDLSTYMRKVYDFYNEDHVLGKQLMNYLLNTSFNDRLPKLLPKGVKVAHKIGNQVQAIHDVGIIFGDKPYVLAVMSKNINESQAYDVIANISLKVYKYVQATY